MKRKWLVIGILFLFIGTSIIPAIAQNTEKTLIRGNWLYVGGSGSGNYSTIQEAINDSSDGDTIYVFGGTYHEAITINVMNLNIIGEGRDVTNIDVNWTDTAVTIEKSFVTLRGFTILGTEYGIYVRKDLFEITISDNNISRNDYGVEVEHDCENYQIVLENNIFSSNDCGIYLVSWSKIPLNIIRNNTFINNDDGIIVGGNEINKIMNNVFLHCDYTALYIFGESTYVIDNVFRENSCGLLVSGANHTITGNIFIGNHLGQTVGPYTDSSGNRITGNHFENNSLGLRIAGSKNSVNTNNFIQNEKHAKFAERTRSHGNNWDTNYWSGALHLFGFAFIFGKVQTSIKKLVQFDPYSTFYYWIPWINFDRDPAAEPYDI